MTTPTHDPEKILLLLPGEEASSVESSLADENTSLHRCPDRNSLLRELPSGTVAVVASARMLLLHGTDPLPLPQNVPLLLILDSEESRSAMQVLQRHEGVVPLESPLSLVTLKSVLRLIRENCRLQGLNRDLPPQASSTLNASRERLRGIFDQAAVGIGLCSIEGNFLQVNRRLSSMLGYSEEELCTKGVWELTAPEDIPALSALSQKLKSGEVSSFHLEKRFICKDGARLWVGQSCSASFDADGTINHIVSFIEDISARKQAEAALKESEERLRLAADAAGIGIWDWDIHGRRASLDWRCRSLLGLPVGEVIPPARFLRLLSPEDRRLVPSEMTKALSSGEDLLTEVRVRMSGGRQRWVQVRGRADLDEGGNPVRVIGILMDITDRKKAEEVLRRAKESADEANRAKTEFLANMSHEIRTPLTVIMGALELLEGTQREGEQKNYIKMAQTASETLLRLIEDLLDFSRIEAGVMSVRNEPFDLKSCIQNIVNSFSLDAERKGLQFCLNVSDRVPGIADGDRDRLRQVLNNLIGNAIKFTEEGSVSIEVSPDESRPSTGGKSFIRFSIRDTGIGVAPEKFNRLFKTFSQVDSSMTRRYGGTGLGLALSKRIVERLGGEIWMESCPGQGSVFSFSLPLVRTYDCSTQQDQGAVRDSQVANRSESRLVRILLAEDEPLVRDMVEMLIAHKGWKVTTVASGLHALKRWEQEHFDLILMDVQMPEMDGYEASRTIRRREAGLSHIPIVALTAHAREQDRQKCFSAGMDAYLSKPIQREELTALVERYLRGAWA